MLPSRRYLVEAGLSYGFPYEGKLSPQATDEVGQLHKRRHSHLIRHGFRRATFPS